jgi:hypothetical protein
MRQTNMKAVELVDKKSYLEPIATKIILEKRNVHQDRRKINTYLADEQRSGIADRRKAR